ncbi:MAG: potassium transporter TrkG [Pyrinomonadaceae bacterium]
MLAKQRKRYLGTSGITVISFFSLIMFLTILLWLPVTTNHENPIDFIDLVFVATSAVCVTGLSTIDISKDLTLYGQVLVLLGMQIGGLGIMTFSTVIYSFIGRRIPVVSKVALEETFLANRTKQARILFIYVLKFTFGCEALGTLLLTGYWVLVGKFENVSTALWFALFHSVSAFTNGSFSLFSNSLGDFTDDPFVLATIGSLILLGGLGFFVCYEIQEYVRSKAMSSRARVKLSLQSKITLAMTAGITLFGSVLIFMLEYHGAFETHTFFSKLVNSVFYTIVPRTSGFETVPMTQFSGSTLLIIMILMLIGAGAGSTGGGIKVGTAGVILAYFVTRFRGLNYLTLWHRTIPQKTIDKSMALLAAFFLMIIGFTVALMFSETSALSGAESQKTFLPTIFEVISALSTVGLSLGITPFLSELGKVTLIVTMFVGRDSPLVLAIVLSNREHTQKFRYSDENIMVG